MKVLHVPSFAILKYKIYDEINIIGFSSIVFLKFKQCQDVGERWFSLVLTVTGVGQRAD